MWRNGRREGLKILYHNFDVWVQVPPQVGLASLMVEPLTVNQMMRVRFPRETCRAEQHKWLLLLFAKQNVRVQVPPQLGAHRGEMVDTLSLDLNFEGSSPSDAKESSNWQDVSL